MGDTNFFPVDLDAILNDNNIDAAWLTQRHHRVCARKTRCQANH